MNTLERKEYPPVDDDTQVESPRDIITYTTDINIESLQIRSLDELTWQWSYQYQGKTIAFSDDVCALIEIHYQQCKLLGNQKSETDKYRTVRIALNKIVDVLDMT